jgi:hypothetical protein
MVRWAVPAGLSWVDLPITTAGTAELMLEVWRMEAFLTPYDGCYVALADALGAEFVTAERKLALELRKRKKRARFLASCERRSVPLSSTEESLGEGGALR